MTVTGTYHTDRPPKLTAPETISRSRDMVGTYQSLNGSFDLTTTVTLLNQLLDMQFYMVT